MSWATRPATPEDADHLARLIAEAGEGIPQTVWAGMAEPGESVWDVGRRRAARDEGAFSYRNARVGTVDGEVVAVLMGYPLPDPPEPWDPTEMPAMFVPMQELEDLAPGSWYVNVLAAYPDRRGRGYGRRLLDEAREMARALGHDRLSIIVNDHNPAQRLYARAGYVEAARRRIVRSGGWDAPGVDWVLMLAEAG
ncbi:MAG: GNAT family N-acetyltransferase [Pseudomonadota bacterium]